MEICIVRYPKICTFQNQNQNLHILKSMACDSMFSHRNGLSLHKNGHQLVAQRGANVIRLEYPHPSISSHYTPQTDSYKNCI